MTIFNIARPGFRAGDIYHQTEIPPPLVPNNRHGTGNFEIKRPSFQAAVVRARLPVDFNRLQALDIENFGTKVRLGTEQLNQLTMINIPDPLDTKWIAEEARLRALYIATGLTPDQILQELEVNKPLGREQRTVSKPSKNIAREAGLTVKSKLDEIKQEIDDGKAQSVADQAQLVGQIAILLNNLQTVAGLSARELALINQSLVRLKVPVNWRSIFPERANDGVIDGGSQYFLDNKGLLTMFILSNIMPGRSVNEPLETWDAGRNRYNPVGVQKIFNMTQANNIRYLDLDNLQVDTPARLAAKGLAPPGGFPANIILPAPPAPPAPPPAPPFP